ncbi:MAG: ABC transporter ATP-binding protein, partial [bacterium]|nr:ABC transporter ATP-binding protein [bacterium]
SMLAITHNLDAFRPFLEDQDLVIEIALVDGVGRAIASHPVSVVPRIEWVDDDTAEETHSNAETATLLTVEGLSVDIGGRWNRRSRRLLSEVSFEVEEGEYFSVGGPSGCGKTTLAKTLLGLIAPSEGRILFRASPGGEVEELLPARVPEMRRQIQMIFQDALGTFDPKTTVGETLREILHYSGMREHERQDDRMSPLLESLGLVVPGSDPEPILARFPAEFSGGQRQRLGVVRALLLKPRLLIADEPFASQDIETALEMIDLFREMGERFGIAMILISHDRRLVRRLCRRGIELRDGVVVGGEES